VAQAFSHYIHGVLTFTISTVQTGPECNLFAHLKHVVFWPVAFALLFGRVRKRREDQQRGAVLLTLSQSGYQCPWNKYTPLLIALWSESRLGGDVELALSPVNVCPS
jgi:hypothetical protein